MPPFFFALDTMPDAETINESLAENAAGPKRVQVANQSVEQHSIQDQIAAANHLANQAASGSPFRALRFTKLVPPGAG